MPSKKKTNQVKNYANFSQSYFKCVQKSHILCTNSTKQLFNLGKNPYDANNRGDSYRSRVSDFFFLTNRLKPHKNITYLF